MGTASKPLITALQNKARVIERGEIDTDTKQRGSRDNTVEFSCFPRLVIEAALPALRFAKGVSGRARKDRRREQAGTDDAEAKQRKSKLAGYRP